ncbi:MAG: carbamate kinase [Candidatus Bipolaricaulota bacterium]
MVGAERKVVLVALGGNAILQPGQRGTVKQQRLNIRSTTDQLAEMVLSGEYEMVISHGNGPQVGNILLQNELARESVPQMPLDVCGAQSQGLIGYMIARSLRNTFVRHDREDISIASILTQTVVEKGDPAFDNPTKPVGRYYSEKEAQQLKQEKGYDMMEVEDNKYRRVVPSPEPLRITERPAVAQLLRSGTVVIAGGGGGVPVVEKDGQLRGVEAVIDKDLASAQLAWDLGADSFLILTNVDHVYLNYGTENQHPLSELTIAEARNYLEQGQFGEGSMKPKVEAGIRFLENGGSKVVITSLKQATAALTEGEGTRITPS